MMNPRQNTRPLGDGHTVRPTQSLQHVTIIQHFSLQSTGEGRRKEKGNSCAKHQALC